MVPCPHNNKGKGLEWTLTWTILDLLTRHARKIAMAAVRLAHNPLEIIPIYHGLLSLRVALDIFAQLMIVPMQMSPRLGDGQVSKVLGATSGSIMQGDSVGQYHKHSSMPITTYVLARYVENGVCSACRILHSHEQQ